MLDEERDLLARAQTLDNEALAEVHEIYYDAIFRYVYFRVKGREIAEDLTGEVFLRLLDALQERTAPQNTLRGWLYRVASNVVADHYRRHYRAEKVTLNESIPNPSIGPAEKVATALAWQRVREALTTLTDSQQDVIALRFGQELSIRETAAVMNKSEGAIKQLQARAIAALTRQVRKESDG